MNLKPKKRFYFLFLALMLAFTSMPVSAASLKIKRSGKSMTYKGKQLKVTYDGKNIPITATPAITLDNYNMVPYYYVFYKSGPKMKYSYSDNKNCLNLTYGDTTVKLYNKKKTAYVNGKKKTLAVAPCFVTFVKKNKKVFMIPAKPVCQYFGLTYSYSSSKKTIAITSPAKEPVLPGPSSDITNQGTAGTGNDVANPGEGNTAPDGNTAAPDQSAAAPDGDEASAEKATQASVFKSMSTSQFIKTIGPSAQADAKKSGVMASVTMAQAILESGWGKSDLAQKANNLFGMKTSLSGNTWKGSAWDGKSKYTKKTAEYDKNNKKYYITASFRKYPSVEKSIADHSAYLTNAKNGSALRYKGLAAAKTYKSQLTIIKNGGYATSKTYVSDLCNIIKKYNLDDWD